MASHSSTLAWKIPWMEEPGRLQTMGSLRVGHDWATSLSRIGEGNGNPLQCSCLENPRDGGAWWAAVYGVAQSRTWLKWLSSSRINFEVSFNLQGSPGDPDEAETSWNCTLSCVLPLHYHDSSTLFFKFEFIYFNGRLITLQYCIGFAIHPPLFYSFLQGALPY